MLILSLARVEMDAHTNLVPEHGLELGHAAPLLRPEPRAFADAYVEGFVRQLSHIQDEYGKYARAFDTLFKYRPWDAAGSLACRWSNVLKRLREADARGIGEMIRGHLAGNGCA